MPHALALVLSLALAPSQTAAVPNTPPLQTLPSVNRLRLHLDCDDCFEDYLRTEIQWVDFVRQPQDADVQLLSTRRETGAGGREHVLRFIGHGRFRGIEQELRAVSLPGESEDVERRGVLRAVSVGLLGYLAREGLPSTLNLSVRPGDGTRELPGKDRWNFWVLSVSGEGSVDAEESDRLVSWEAGITADRVTEQWKVSFGVSIDEEIEHFDLDDDEPFTVRRRERTFEWFAAKSLGEHWSAGVEGELGASSFSNTKLSIGMSPAIEYNIFPYSQQASRQLRIQYAIGAVHTRYNEVTLFDRLEESRPRHRFSTTLDQRQPWGTLEAAVVWSQYLHDRTKYRLEFESELSFRMARGLSVEIEGSASRIRDQLALPRRDATPEEVLLRFRELQSGYEVNMSAGFTYTFGSIFNNIVNPRFGR